MKQKLGCGYFAVGQLILLEQGHVIRRIHKTKIGGV